MDKPKYRILVADDEPKYVYIIQLNLETRGYEVLVARDGQAAVELAAAESPDLVILDIRMPQLNGYEACRQIRQFSQVPIIMLTALAEDANKVKGLDLGADDYITKPFSIEELLARVRAVLRRADLIDQTAAGPVFDMGKVHIDLSKQVVLVDNEEITLTKTEFHLLVELAKQAGRIVLADHLLETIWGPAYTNDERILRQAIYRLRQKIEPDPRNPQFIQTRSGLGYLFTPPADEE